MWFLEFARETENQFWMNQLSLFSEARQLPLFGKDQVVHLVLKKYQALAVSRVQLQILGSLMIEFLDLQPSLCATRPHLCAEPSDVHQNCL